MAKPLLLRLGLVVQPLEQLVLAPLLLQTLLAVVYSEKARQLDLVDSVLVLLQRRNLQTIYLVEPPLLLVVACLVILRSRLLPQAVCSDNLNVRSPFVRKLKLMRKV